MDAAAGALGGIDVLVNIAGAFRWETLAAGKLETWDFLYSVNLKTAVCACKAVLPHLSSQHGRIINIGANAAAKAGAGMGAYTASKAGIAKLTEALAEELKDQGVTVNAVLPSVIDTPANRADMPNADFTALGCPRHGAGRNRSFCFSPPMRRARRYGSVDSRFRKSVSVASPRRRPTRASTPCGKIRNFSVLPQQPPLK